MIGRGYSEEDFVNLENAVQSLVNQAEFENFSGGRERQVIVRLDGKYPLDDSFAQRLSNALRLLIEEITPIVDEFEDERANQEASP